MMRLSRAFDKETRDERIATWRRFAAAGVPIVPTLAIAQAFLRLLERLRAIVDDDAGTVEPRRAGFFPSFKSSTGREQLVEQSVEGQQQLRKYVDQGLLAVREMHEAGWIYWQEPIPA